MSHHSTASNRQRAVFMRLRLELLPVPSPPSLALSSSTLTRLFRTGGEPILYAEPTNRYSAWRPRRRCMPPTGGIPQHHCHTAIPRVVRPVPRSLHRKRYKTLARQVSLCREAACARASSLGVRRIVSAAYRRGQPSAASCRYVPGDEANCSPDDMKNCTLGCGKNVGAGCCQRLLKRCRRQLPDVIRPG
jgi:hypothetical protein